MKFDLHAPFSATAHLPVDSTDDPMAAKKTVRQSKTLAKPRGKPAPLTEPPSPDPHKAFNLVMRMMAIEGKSGEEARIVRFIQSTLERAGVPDSWIKTDSAHQHTPIRGDTGNLYLKLPGTHRGQRRLLMAHLDTVPICVGSAPVKRGGFVRPGHPTTGLGADDRAGAAVVLHTALEILRNNYPHPPLTFFWTVQEEVGLQGARHARLDMLGRPEMAFNWDGGAAGKVTVGATGGYRMRIDVHGIASHAGGAPERGVSAVAVAALAVADLHRHGWHGQIVKGNNRGTCNVGFIRGGEATNVVTDHVVLRAEARSHDKAFRERIVQEIESAFRRAAGEVQSEDGQTGRVKIEGSLDYESFKLVVNEPSLSAAEAAIRAFGGTPEQAISNGGVDANWMVARGIPTVTLGCGQINQHMTSEALDIKEFHEACRIALCLATGTEGCRDGS
jgi:tripeptide aminopeptidase